jgi:hypothetical protein
MPRHFTCGLMLLLMVLPLKAADDLQALNDQFNDAATLNQWLRVRDTEGWSASPLRVCDINKTRPGHLVMQPYTSTWYQDYIGELLYQ